MFETIVWATDGSENADRALPYARGLATGAGKKLVAVHVKELLVGRAGGYPVLADEDELAAKVEAQAEELREAGIATTVRLTTVTTHGPAHSIAEIAREAGADVIVVGTRGHRPVAGAVLGSVAQHLLHDAYCPVLAIPPLTSAQPAEAAAPETVGAGT